MTRRRALALLLPMLVPPLSRPALARPAQAQGPDRCEAPSALSTAMAPLPRSAAAVRAQRPLRIFAIGNASMGTAPPGSTPYVVRLGDLLERVLGIRPEIEAQVLRGTIANDMRPALHAGLATLRPDLVIWQTGTVDAVRNVDPDAFQAAVEAGVDKVHAAQADMLLVDMQFARWSRASIDYGPYQTAILELGAVRELNVFRRYDLMQYWAEERRIDLERAPADRRKGEEEQLRACLAQQLARMIAGGIALGAAR